MKIYALAGAVEQEMFIFFWSQNMLLNVEHGFLA